MDQKLVQLTQNIWLWPHHPDPDVIQASIGLITGPHSSILVDAGNSPDVAERLKAAIQRAGLPKVESIIYTHHHWDHIWGACAFQVPVVAHKKCRDILMEEAKKPWGPQYLNYVVERNPKMRASVEARARAMRQWETFRIVLPEIVFNRIKVIDLEGMRVALEHVGGDHAEDSIVVRVPEDGVLFVGDCYYPPPLHLRTSESTHSIPMLASLKDKRYSLYIEGHDDPFTRAELVEFLESDQPGREVLIE